MRQMTMVTPTFGDWLKATVHGKHVKGLSSYGDRRNKGSKPWSIYNTYQDRLLVQMQNFRNDETIKNVTQQSDKQYVKLPQELRTTASAAHGRGILSGCGMMVSKTSRQ